MWIKCLLLHRIKRNKEKPLLNLLSISLSNYNTKFPDLNNFLVLAKVVVRSGKYSSESSCCWFCALVALARRFGNAKISPLPCLLARWEPLLLLLSVVSTPLLATCSIAWVCLLKLLTFSVVHLVIVLIVVSSKQIDNLCSWFLSAAPCVGKGEKSATKFLSDSQRVRSVSVCELNTRECWI